MAYEAYRGAREVREAWIVGAVRTPVGRHGGALSSVRPDDLAATALSALVERTGIPSSEIEDVYLGCANQAGEDNRNVARMAALLAGLSEEVAGATVNRLCGSGLEAVASAARAVMLGEADVYVGGGVESMSRAPWVMEKPERAYPAGHRTVYDTTLGWRMTNPRMGEMGHTDSLGMTAENLAEERYAVPVPATKKALDRAGITMDDIGLVELNEAFAAQSLAVIHEWGMAHEDERLNPNGGAIALGHPLGCSGARILTTLVHEMGHQDIRYGLATMCIGVGQGIAMIVELPE